MNKEYRLNLYLSYAHALSDSAHIIFGLTLYFVSDNLNISILTMGFIYNLFDKIQIVKPYSSKSCNSEQYVIGIGFKGISNDICNWGHKCNSINCTFRHNRVPRMVP